jgi:hypothetical protein
MRCDQTISYRPEFIKDSTADATTIRVRLDDNHARIAGQGSALPLIERNVRISDGRPKACPT